MSLSHYPLLLHPELIIVSLDLSMLYFYLCMWICKHNSCINICFCACLCVYMLTYAQTHIYIYTHSFSNMDNIYILKFAVFSPNIEELLFFILSS